MQRNKITFALFVGLAIMAAFVFFDRYPLRRHGIESKPRAIEPRGDLAEFEKSTIDIFTSAGAFRGLHFYGKRGNRLFRYPAVAPRRRIGFFMG